VIHLHCAHKTTNTYIQLQHNCYFTPKPATCPCYWQQSSSGWPQKKATVYSCTGGWWFQTFPI
jgi:hypothetical protein